MPFFSRDNHVPRNRSSTAVKGVVEAGFPSAAGEELDDLLSVDAYLIENKEASYMLRMVGNAMSDEGIADGDILIIERGKIADSGDIMVVCADGEYILQKLSGGTVPRVSNAELIGTVIGLMRKY
jgi:SOS-response transcriptional repressor LexA